MNKKILFPTAFGKLSEMAWSNVICMAEKLQTEIVVMHSIQSPNVLSRLFSSYDEEGEREKVEHQLQNFRDQLATATSAGVSTMIMEGSPDHAIVEAARNIDAEMVIFGTEGGEGLRDTLLGSPVNHVIRHAHCPVLTFREKPDQPGFHRILVLLDTVREAPQQVVWSLKMAHFFGAELHFLALMTGDAEHNKKVDNRVRNAVRYAHGNGVEVAELHLEPLDREVEVEVEEFARRIEADLVCVVTQSDDEKGLQSMLRGSTADRLVNHCHVPVLSVPPIHE